MINKYKSKLFFVFGVGLFLLSAVSVLAQEYSSYSACLNQIGDPNQCCQDFPGEPSCSTTPTRTDPTCPDGYVFSNGACVLDPNDAPTIPTGRGDTNIPPLNNGGTSNPSNPGQFCPSNDFEIVNGLCVPKDKSNPDPDSLRGASTIFGLVAIVLRWLLTFAGIIATVYLIIGGYQYITSGGNEEQSEKGKKTLVSAIIGVVIVILSITIITIVTNTLGSPNPVGQVSKITKLV